MADLPELLSDNARLSGLRISAPSAEVTPGFDPETLGYSADVGFLASTVVVTAVAEDPAASIEIEGQEVVSAEPSSPIDLSVGLNELSIVVTAENGDERTYSVHLARATDLVGLPSYFKASNTESFDHFGFSVAVSGDTLAVAARDEDSSATGIDGDEQDDGAPESGAVFVFVRENGGWSQQAYLKASNTGAADYFGHSLALHEDTLVVGAPFEDSASAGVNGDSADNSSDRSGAAYVFVRDNGLWSQQAYLKASNPDPLDGFGTSVAVWGDSIVVGAPYEASFATGVNGNQSDDSVSESGAAYLFVRNGSTWTQQAYLKASNTQLDDHFGREVGVWDDTLVVAAVDEDSGALGVNGNQGDNSALNSGAVYVFVRRGLAWTQQAYLKASNTGASDNFGDSLAIDGETVAVGAILEDSRTSGVGSTPNDAGVDNGAVYVFVRSGEAWSQQAYVKASNTGDGDLFGHSLALSGDRLLVGADGEDSSAIGLDGNESTENVTDAGAAYLYLRSAGAWSKEAYLKASNTDVPDHFGFTVAISGDLLAIGALYEDSLATGIDGDGSNEGASESGAVYLYR